MIEQEGDNWSKKMLDCEVWICFAILHLECQGWASIIYLTLLCF